MTDDDEAKWMTITWSPGTIIPGSRQAIRVTISDAEPEPKKSFLTTLKELVVPKIPASMSDKALMEELLNDAKERDTLATGKTPPRIR